MATELCWTPAWRIQEMFALKELSPVEFIEMILRRAEQLNPAYSMFITVCAEQALKAARGSERRYSQGRPLSKIDGIPFSVKDQLLTKGVRSTLGSLLFEDYVPEYDSTPVGRLRAAGAVLFAKANLPEFSNYRSSVNRLVPETRNAWDRQRSSGGSSGGSAVAVALGVAPMSLGTDGGGSMRLPAMLNGIFGLMPSMGRVPRGPGLYAAPMSGVAPMTRDVRDAARFLSLIAQPDPSDPFSMITPAPDFEDNLDEGVRDVRVAWSADFGRVKVQNPAVLSVVHEAARAFSELGARLEEPDLHNEDTWDQLARDQRYTLEAAMARLRTDHPDMYDLSDFLRDVVQDPIKRSKLCIYVLDRSLPPTATEYTMSLHPDVRDRPINHLEEVFAEYDLLLSPTYDRTAWVCGEAGIVPPTYVSYTHIANTSGYCAASVPAGFVDGLPVGLHLMARPGEEDLLFRACRAFERARPWSDHRPPDAL